MARTSPSSRRRNERWNESKPREWRFPDLIWLALAAIVLFSVVFWAALGKPPLSGTKVAAVLGFAFVVFANLNIRLCRRSVPSWRVTGQVPGITGDDRAGAGIHGRPSVSMARASKKDTPCLAAVDR